VIYDQDVEPEAPDGGKVMVGPWCRPTEVVFIGTDEFEDEDDLGICVDLRIAPNQHNGWITIPKWMLIFFLVLEALIILGALGAIWLVVS
jgi:hypothetical protein